MSKAAGCSGLLGLAGMAVAGVALVSMTRGEGLDTWPMLCGGGLAGLLFGSIAIGMMAPKGRKNFNHETHETHERGERKEEFVDTRQTHERVVLSRGYTWQEGGKIMSDRSREYLIYEGYAIGVPGVDYPGEAPVLLPEADGCYHLPGVVLHGVELGGAILAPEFFNQWRDGDA